MIVLIHQYRFHPRERATDGCHIIGLAKNAAHHGKPRFRAAVGILNGRHATRIVKPVGRFRSCPDHFQIGARFFVQANVGRRQVERSQLLFEDKISKVIEIPEFFFRLEKRRDPIHRIVNEVQNGMHE